MFFEGGRDVMREVRERMRRLESDLTEFINSEDVSSLLHSQLERGGKDEGKGKGESGQKVRNRRREIIFEKKLGSVELKRRKDALSSERRAKVLQLMGELERRIEGDLRGVEDLMWPRKIIKFDSPASSTRDEVHDEESQYWIVRIWVWICELVEEIWEDGGEIVSGVLRGCWGLLRAWNLLVLGTVLVGGLAFVVAYLHI